MKVVSIAQDGAQSSQVKPFERRPANLKPEIAARPTRLGGAALFVMPRRAPEELSAWSNSAGKRCFDCVCVLLALPLLVPILLLIALAVWLTSAGPVLFLQKRVGCHGRTFTILKFRTLIHDRDARYHAVTTAENQPFTPVGPFLRRWKLDELPQVFNVLLGHMSLVGPRPKMPEHVKVDLPCRPGITGAATIAFAREETILDRVPRHSLDDYYHRVILPAKRQLDAEYMARATFFSDLRLIVNSVLRRWDSTLADSLLEGEFFDVESSARDAEAEAIAASAMVSEPVGLRTGTR